MGWQGQEWISVRNLVDTALCLCVIMSLVFVLETAAVRSMWDDSSVGIKNHGIL